MFNEEKVLRPAKMRFEDEPVFRANFMKELATAATHGDLALVKTILNQLEVKPNVLSSDQLTAGDNQALDAILKMAKGGRFQLFAEKLGEYYQDADRADRTPRALIYHHIGWLVTAVQSVGIRIGGKVH